ncbi:hypothetical protein [Elioraea tepidiphila]|jgi:hypothetical protein|uniref:hypothetical protein n=1 Tax=Elioraea tepidiphila TaxID=457934 RepID=UPI00037B34DC|nr:hypothetical protein [Elioraea tepidiphila]
MTRELRMLLVGAAIEAGSSDPATVAAFLMERRAAALKAALTTLAARVFGRASASPPGEAPAEPATAGDLF